MLPKGVRCSVQRDDDGQGDRARCNVMSLKVPGLVLPVVVLVRVYLSPVGQVDADREGKGCPVSSGYRVGGGGVGGESYH